MSGNAYAHRAPFSDFIWAETLSGSNGAPPTGGEKMNLRPTGRPMLFLRVGASPRGLGMPKTAGSQSAPFRALKFNIIFSAC